ncbi:hypothetical protein EV356DRAFT_179874 [Viridothelium virens]|uniref:Uncharacterized protein n=1 Tax=Viridothelium virens TaxID=1048519 RepID=A0A6A6H850_VIRVR|nr:hypothetical protein EV356DRAFT_179874 [Viridothelium virens]
MDSIIQAFLSCWLTMLGLKRETPESWHRERLTDELQEFQEAKGAVEKLSEESDVFFCISRARHDGFPLEPSPTFWTRRNALVYTYMVLKLTSRWLFYLVAAWCCGVPTWMSVREVVNPSKDVKLERVAGRHGIDPAKFKRVGKRLLRVWPLQPETDVSKGRSRPLMRVGMDAFWTK